MNENRFVIELKRNALLPLQDSKGARLVCLEGTLWITHQDHQDDIVIHTGDAYEVPHDGTTLVQAMQAARIAVEGSVQIFRAAA